MMVSDAAVIDDEVVINGYSGDVGKTRHQCRGEDNAMTRLVAGLVLAVLLSTPAFGQDRIGETCSGTETIEAGTSAPKTVPYSLTFSMDLKSGYYCYAECKPEQTYAISDRLSDPIKLADVHAGSQARLTTFSRKSRLLADDQVIQVLGTMKRSARATCQPSAFHEPTPLPEN